jgi:hypothetical protein
MKKKTKPSIHNSSCSDISVISESKEQVTKLELDISKELHDGLVRIGKEYASDSDYIEIAVRVCLEDYVESIKES